MFSADAEGQAVFIATLRAAPIHRLNYLYFRSSAV